MKRTVFFPLNLSDVKLNRKNLIDSKRPRMQIYFQIRKKN